jgi:hypothetical protein
MEATKQPRRERLAELRKKLANLNPDERQAMAEGIGVLTVEGRSLSVNNQILLAFQHPKATIVGGGQQWKRAGRIVRKGEHGSIIWFPTIKGDGDTPEDQEVNFLTGIVFDITQTDPINKEDGSDTK